MRKLLLLVAYVLGIASVTGGPVEPGHIDAQASWIVHLDVEQFARTPLSALIQKNLEASPVKAKMHELISNGSFDPRQDLLGMTAYGSQMEASQATCLMYGHFDPELLKANTNIIWRSEQDNIHPGTTTAPPLYGDLLNTNLLVVSRTPQNIDDLKRNFGEHAFSQNELRYPEQAFLSVWILNPGSQNFPAQAEVLKRAKKLTLYLSGTGKSVEGLLTLTADDPMMALGMSQILQGMLSASLLKAEPGSDTQTMLRRTRLSVENETVRARISIPLSVAENYVTTTLIQNLNTRWATPL